MATAGFDLTVLALSRGLAEGVLAPEDLCSLEVSAGGGRALLRASATGRGGRERRSG